MTDKPSVNALRAARAMCQGNKIYVYGGLPEFCGHNKGWADEEEIARIIDKYVTPETEYRDEDPYHRMGL